MVRSDDYTKGIVYRVQIGAFNDPKLKDLQTKGQFWVEEEDGMKKYTIANFRDYWEADIFKKYIREMGSEGCMDCSNMKIMKGKILKIS